MSPAHRQRTAHSIASSSLPAKAPQQTLARRLLVHPHSNDELPPLLSTQGLPPELSAELYDFIAMALRAFVNTWWTKLTRYDKELLPHINKILVHTIAGLEDRLRTVDIPALVFHDLPTIITQHYVDYRNVQSKLSTSYAAGGATSLPHLFAQIQPHMAMSAAGKIDSEYFRQIFDQVLKLSLPPEDYEPEVERVIVREILVKLVVGEIIPKLSQPWFIHKTILDLIGQSEDGIYVSQDTSPTIPSQDASFFHNFVVVVLSALQTFSGICLALMQSYKQTVSTIKLVNQSTASPPTSGAVEIPAPAPLSDSPPSTNTRPSLDSNGDSPKTALAPSAPQPEEHRYYLSPPLNMVSEIIQSRDRFSSNLFITILSMLFVSMPGFLDKLSTHLLFRFLSPTFILHITRLSKRTMFPNGYPGPPPVEPTAEEQAELRARLVNWRPKGSLMHVLPIVLGPNPTATLEDAVDPLSDAHCNARVIVFIFDRIVCALYPELVG